MKTFRKFCTGLMVFFITLTAYSIQVSNQISALTYNEFPCADGQYSLETVSQNPTTNQANYTLVKCFNTFNEANSALKSMSAKQPNLVVRNKSFAAPLKVMSQATGYAIATKGVTVYIYRNPNLTSSTADWTTYVVKGSKLYYYESMLNAGGKLVHRVSISGYDGYISSDVSDLLPMQYVIHDLPFVLRNGTYNQSYPKTNTNHYQVRSSGNGYNELLFYYQPINSSSGYWIGPYAQAPSWLAPGYYYSRDGITFYTDPNYQNVVNNGAKFYNYFQYLPLRSRSNLTGQQLDNYLRSIGRTNSIYYGKSQTFVDGQENFGMNALLIFSMAGIESAFGTSNIAKNKNNLFGWNAIDSDPSQATRYARVEDSILQHMAVNLFGYTNVSDYRFTGPSLGNKGHGFNTKYASDPNWGLSIATVAYKVDKFNGFQDLNYYKLGVLQDKSNINVRQKASPTSPIYYNTRGGDKQLINQTVAITNKVNDFYETIAWYPIVNGNVLKSHNKGAYSMNLKSNQGYISSSLINIVNSGSYHPQEPPIHIPIQPIGSLPGEKEYEVTATLGLNVRSQPNSTSLRIGGLSYKTKFMGVAEGGWIKLVHNGQIGYVSADYVQLVQQEPVAPTPEPTPEPKPTLVNPKEYVVTATLGLIIREKPSASTLKVGGLKYNTTVVGVMENGWLKIIHEGKYAYVSGEYVKLVNQSPVIKKGDINNDGKISSIDYIALANHILKRSTLSGDKLTAADINGDGVVSSIDYIAIANHILGKKLIP